jgi:hypothetical protein
VKRTFILALAGVGFLAIAAACETDDSPAAVTGADAGTPVGGECTWGTTRSCSCDAGAIGESRCLSNGRYGGCICASVGSSEVGASEAGSSEVGSDATPLDSLPDTPAEVPPGFELTRSLPITGRHLFSDVARRRLYVTVGGTAAQYPNSLAIIDPVQLKVIAAVPVGSEPGLMAMSDDGSTLWVGLDGAFAIRRIDLTTDPPIPGAQYPLPRAMPFDYPGIAASMVVLPGAPGSVLVSSASMGSYSTLALLDDGKLRGTPPAFFGSGIPRLALGPSGLVFGAGPNFLVITISATGYTAKSHPLAFGSDDILRIGNRVFARSGVVVDVSNPAAPTRAGQFGYSGMLIPGPRPNRLIMLSQNSPYSSGDLTLRLLDGENYVQVASTLVKNVRERSLWGFVSVSADTGAFLGAPDTIPLPNNTPSMETRLHILTSALWRDPR